MSRGCARVFKICVLVLTPIALYVTCSAHETIENNGWRVSYGYVRFMCPTCTGRIEELTCQGEPVPKPRFPNGQANLLSLQTPVGTLNYVEPGYRLLHRPVGSETSDEEITPEDLDRGYHHWRMSSRQNTWERRKRGTPTHWCMAVYGDHVCWLDPQKLAEIEWDRPVPTREP